MTRFARAKGSKASNERLPEQATSWGVMKQQLLEKNKETEVSAKRKEADKKRVENYKAFLEEVEDSKISDVKWADFPGTRQGSNKKKKRPAEISERNNSDSDDDGPPEEVSAKVLDPEIKVVKKKAKKRPLKIVLKKQEEELAKNEQLTSIQPLKGTQDKVGAKAEGMKMEIAAKNSKKRKAEGGKEVSRNIKKAKKPVEELTEAELKKIEKKKQKRLKQLEKKKLKKELKKQQEAGSMENFNTSDPQNQLTKNCENPTKDKHNAYSEVDESSQIVNRFERTTTKPFKRPQQPKAAEKNKNDSEKPERRKKCQEKMTLDGKEVDIAYYDGFPIKKEDAERIIKLRKQMISKGLPRSEIKVALKVERRKAEKVFSREKKKVCFKCRKSGHNLSECPELGQKQLTESSVTGICFKCGSTEHTHFECKLVRGQEFKFAQCFICNEQGHIARQCPDNARGLYPNGGGCNVCGDVTHLKRDCPKYQSQQQQEENSVHLETLDARNPDSLDGQSEEVGGLDKGHKRQNKVIKF